MAKINQEAKIFENFVNAHINSKIKITIDIDGKSYTSRLTMSDIQNMASCNISAIKESAEACFQEFINDYKRENDLR